MKFRSCFVANSSSASFVIVFKSSLKKEEVLNIIKQSCLVKTKNINRAEFYFDEDHLDLSKKGGYYKLIQSTHMFNDWYNIECWKFIRALSENKLKNFELYKIIKTEEEYSDCNYETTFSKFPWNYDFDDEKVEAEKDLKKNNEEYYTYLYSIDPDLEDDDKLDFSEILLSK